MNLFISKKHSKNSLNFHFTAVVSEFPSELINSSFPISHHSYNYVRRTLMEFYKRHGTIASNFPIPVMYSFLSQLLLSAFNSKCPFPRTAQ